MRWSKKNKELIKQVIDRYHWMLEKKSRIKTFFGNLRSCSFCNEYHCYRKDWIECLDGCPNVIMTDILNCFNYNEFYSFDCVQNAMYTGLKTKWNGYCDNIIKSKSNIEKRLQFWEDALTLTKKEFIGKYKRR